MHYAWSRDLAPAIFASVWQVGIEISGMARKQCRHAFRILFLPMCEGFQRVTMSLFCVFGAHTAQGPYYLESPTSFDKCVFWQHLWGAGRIICERDGAKVTVIILVALKTCVLFTRQNLAYFYYSMVYKVYVQFTLGGTRMKNETRVPVLCTESLFLL